MISEVPETIEGITLGCDPELFVMSSETGQPVPAGLFIPGDKENPHPVPFGAVQVDGLAAEFNINPASSFEEFDNNIIEVLDALMGFLPSGYFLSACPSIVFPEEGWEGIPAHAKELGCSPDFNAWTGNVNPPPVPPKDNPRLRTASGHIHIGFTEGMEDLPAEHIEDCRTLVKQLDFWLGPWSLKWDTDPTRRLLYGKAGACRYKPYGVEYRVLSNFWVSSRDLRQKVWENVMGAISGLMDGLECPSLFGESVTQSLVEAINTSNLRLLPEGFGLQGGAGNQLGLDAASVKYNEYLAELSNLPLGGAGDAYNA